MEAPKVIWAGGSAKNFNSYWCDTPHPQPELSRETMFIRADAPELVALVEALRWVKCNGGYANRENVIYVATDALAAWEALTNG